MKIKLIFFIICSALLVSGAMYYGNKMMEPRGKLINGKIIIDDNTPASIYVSTGNFVVRWNTENGGHLVITHTSNPQKELWASVPGSSFVNAASGDQDATESHGMLIVKENLNIVCNMQRIDDIHKEFKKILISGTLECNNSREPVKYALTFDPNGDNQLAFSLEIKNNKYGISYLTYSSTPDERFFGFGIQYTYFNMKGRRLPIVVSEQGIGRGQEPITSVLNLTAKAGGSWHTSYTCVPHYITSRMNSLFLENYEPSVFDMRPKDRVQIQVFSRHMKGRIIYGNSPKEIIKEYTSIAGRMRPLPDWILDGAILGLQGGTERVKKIYASLRDLGTPISALWLQDWEGQRVTRMGKQLWWNWELDWDRYPGWDKLVNDLNRENVKLMVYINPFIVDVVDKKNHRRSLFDEARGKGYLVKNELREPYMIANTTFSAGMIDLTNPKAREWIKDVIKKELVGSGVSGWMADFGEALPFDAVLYSGEPASSYHNRYPEEWARVNREAIEESGLGDEIVFFSRSGYIHSPDYSTLFWLGDQSVTWDKYDGIKTAVTGLLTSGISGFSLNHSDIGGFTGVPNKLGLYQRKKELLLRWMELNAFTTVFRSHEGNTPDGNAQFYSDAESMEHFSRCAKIYKAWAFYRKQLVREASETGMPVVRHLFLNYPSDPEVLTLSYQQFMVGTEFIVAPVLDKGKKEATVYLPTGKWKHLWSGKEYGNNEKGIRVTIYAPLGKPAVFFKTGSKVAEIFITNLKNMGVM
jgi:sulfoquinovosidase